MAATIEELMAKVGNLGNGIQDLQGQVSSLSAIRPAFQAGQVYSTMAAKTKGLNGGFRDVGHFAQAVRALYTPSGQLSGEVVSKAKGLMERWGNEFVNRNKAGDWGGGDWAVRTKANSPTGMAEGFTGADGGYLVPPEFAAQILMRSYANDLLSRCTVLPVGGNSIKIPAIDESSRANGSRFGGVQAYWRREGASVTATKPRIADIDLSLESLMLTVRTSEEILSDTGGVLEVLLTTIASQELTFKSGDAIVNGDGVGKPLGIMNSSAKITQAAEPGQGAGTIVSENVLKMWSRMHVSARPNAVWLYDQSIEPALATMTIGTAGAQLAMWMPPGGLSQSLYGTLLGRPMIPVEFCQQLGTEGDLILVDLSQVLAATKGGVQTAVSMHLYFDTNEMAFRFILRFDAKPWWLTALTPKSGGPTQSCIVTLNSTRT